MIFQLIYTCALRHDVSASELDAIAESSRLRNLKNGVTGILLCKEGSVLQVLEGHQTVVNDLYNKISSDPRVSNSLVLIKRHSTEREFPNWSMGYRNADTDEVSFELTSDSFQKVMPRDLSPEVDTIGWTFARVNGLT